MRPNSVTGFVLAIGLLCAGGIRAGAANYTWTGSANDGVWTNPVNWDAGVPPNGAAHTVIFDNGSAADRVITYGGPTDSSRATGFSFLFASGAKRYVFADDYIENSGGTANLTTSLGMTNDQYFTGWRFGTTTPVFTLGGSGDVTVSNFFTQNGWTAANFITLTLSVTNDAVLTFGGLKGVATPTGRRLLATKSGPGKLVLGGTVEYPYGTNVAGIFTSNVFRVTGGEVDISTATLKLTNALASSAYAIPTNVVYMLLDYSNATLVGGSSFASVTNLPPGFEIFNDTSKSRIVLRQAPPSMPREYGCVVAFR